VSEFVAAMPAHGERPEQISEVVMDMRPAYIAGVKGKSRFPPNRQTDTGLIASSDIQRLPFGLPTLSQNHSAKRNLLAGCLALDDHIFDELLNKKPAHFCKSTGEHESHHETRQGEREYPKPDHEFDVGGFFHRRLATRHTRIAGR